MMTTEDQIHEFCADARWRPGPGAYGIIMPTLEQAAVEVWPIVLAYGRMYGALVNQLNYAIMLKNQSRIRLFGANVPGLLGARFTSVLVLDCANRNQILESLSFDYADTYPDLPRPRFGLGEFNEQ
jgi:hypothetical protein